MREITPTTNACSPEPSDCKLSRFSSFPITSSTLKTAQRRAEHKRWPVPTVEIRSCDLNTGVCVCLLSFGKDICLPAMEENTQRSPLLWAKVTAWSL